MGCVTDVGNNGFMRMTCDCGEIVFDLPVEPGGIYALFVDTARMESGEPPISMRCRSCHRNGLYVGSGTPDLEDGVVEHGCYPYEGRRRKRKRRLQ